MTVFREKVTTSNDDSVSLLAFTKLFSHQTFQHLYTCWCPIERMLFRWKKIVVKYGVIKVPLERTPL